MPARDAQTSLRLPQELRHRLGSAADAAGRSVGEEIRRRLEASFAGSAPAVEDQRTSDLLRVIARASAILAKEWAAWHADAGAFAVFGAAIEDVLSRQQPETTSAARKTDQGKKLFAGPNAGAVLAFAAEATENLL